MRPDWKSAYASRAATASGSGTVAADGGGTSTPGSMAWRSARLNRRNMRRAESMEHVFGPREVTPATTESFYGERLCVASVTLDWPAGQDWVKLPRLHHLM